jgi:RHS repeat-associated protein
MQGAPANLDDGNPCTEDACDDPAIGITHTPVAAGEPCGDGNLCNPHECDGNGTCVATASTPTNDDNNACTLSYCDPFTGANQVVTCSPINAATATNVGSSFAFLYTGPNAPQIGVEEGTIDPVRANAMNGHVMDDQGAGLSGVEVAVLDHPEFGLTTTRSNGDFDLVVNGGEPVTLTFRLGGFLEAQRQVTAEWGGYARASDVVLKSFDPQVTAIDDSAPVYQVARGSVMTDSDGSRQATLLFPPGTTAAMVLANGSTSPLTQLHVRATEYTVGSSGFDAMPAELPPTSGYTYAIEFSVDEALAEGATRVNFNHSIAFYLDNFLNIPTGTLVPSGYYDRDLGEWVPSDNGRVIKITSVTGGIATLDADGDGSADTSAELAAQGITLQEQQQLAALFPPGKILWRTPISHFSTWDCNFPYGPAPDDCAPSASCGDTPDPRDPDPDPKACEGSGSIIECQNQVLRESVPVAGTPFSLEYSSDRSPGYKVGNSLEIPITGSSPLPATAIGSEVTIEIAGREFHQTFSTAPNQSYTFSWDGLDQFGRHMQGGQTATVSLGYIYNGVYMEPLERDKAFALLSGIPMLANRERRELTLLRTSSHLLNPWIAKNAGLGGWSLNAHHAYDPRKHIVYLGDGREENPDRLFGGKLTPVSGLVPSLDNVAALSQVAAGSDGSLYLVDTPHSRILHVGVDGIITTVAGQNPNLLHNHSADSAIVVPGEIPGWTNVVGTWITGASNPDPFEGSKYFHADASPEAELRQDVDVSSVAAEIDAGTQPFSFDGYVESFPQVPTDAARIVVEYRDAMNQTVLQAYDSGQIRQYSQWQHLTDSRMAPVGTRWVRVRLIATRFNGVNNDGYFDALSLRAGPAVATSDVLNHPRGVAVGRRGLYIADTDNNRILKLDHNGQLAVVVDSSSSGIDQTVPVFLSKPVAIALGPDGTLYIADGRYRLWALPATGELAHVAGHGNQGFGLAATVENGTPAQDSNIGTIESMAVARDGSLLLAESNLDVVRAIGTDGLIRVVAGRSSVAGIAGDGGLATNALLNNPTGVFASNDGRIFVADKGNNRVRVIQPSGTISTIAGTGVAGTSVGGGPAIASSLDAPTQASLGPDGTLHITDTANDRVCDVASTLPGFSGTDIYVGAENGSEVYHFSGDGLHLETLNATTGAPLYTFEYDDEDRLIRVVDKSGNVTQIERDEAGTPLAIVGPYGQRTTFGTNADGYIETMTDPEGNTHQFGYSAGGLLTTFTNPRGHASTMTYDLVGRLIKDEDAVGGSTTLARSELPSAYSVQKTSSLGSTTQYLEAEGPDGSHLNTSTFPDGTQSVSDERLDGTVVQTQPNGTQVTVTQVADPRWGMAAPLAAQSTTVLPSGLTRVETQSSDTNLSDQADPFSIVTQTESSSINGRTTTTVYDAATQTFTTTTPEGRQSFRTIDDLGRTISSEVAGLDPVDLEYDTDGHLTTITQGDRVTTNTYANSGVDKGYLRTITNALNQTTSFSSDALGRTLSQVKPDGAATTFGYDGNNNLASVTPPGKPEHIQTYTPVDQLESYDPPTLPDVPNPDTTYTYNLDRQLTGMLRPDGVSLTRSYDSAGRLSLITMPTGTILHEYYGNTLCVGCAPGALKRITGPSASIIDLTYDGSLLKSSTWSGAVNGAVSWNYDNDFRQAQETVTPGGATITYGYDNDNLVTCASRGACSPPSTDALKLTYSATNGLLTSTVIGNLTEAFTYNSSGEIATHTATYSGSPIYSGTFHSTAAPRDDLGRITRKVETVGGVTRTDDYQYDTRGRLLNVARNNVLVSVYGYDANGNRLSLTNPSTSTTTLGSYDDQDRVMVYGSYSYAFNANGDLTSKTNTTTSQTTSYDYDVRGALLQAVLPDGTTIDYVTDGRGRRIGKKVNGTQVQGFLYNGLRIAAELGGTGSIVSQFVYADKSSHSPEFMIKDGAVYRFIKDQLGSPLVLINVLTGAMEQMLVYDEFGNVLSDSALGFQPFGFAGGLYDRDTGLVRFGARDYDPGIGRWTARDPLLFKGGQRNLFAYVGNAPTNFIDPSGLYVDVYVWDPVGSGRSSFGHITVDVNGTVYSFGPDGNDVGDPFLVDKNQQFRGADVLELNLTPEQEELLDRSLQDQYDWAFVNNNCGDPLESGLENLGIDLGINITPSSLRESLEEAGVVSGERRINSWNPQVGVIIDNGK